MSKQDDLRIPDYLEYILEALTRIFNYVNDIDKADTFILAFLHLYTTVALIQKQKFPDSQKHFAHTTLVKNHCNRFVLLQRAMA